MGHLSAAILFKRRAIIVLLLLRVLFFRRNAFLSWKLSCFHTNAAKFFVSLTKRTGFEDFSLITWQNVSLCIKLLSLLCFDWKWIVDFLFSNRRIKSWNVTMNRKAITGIDFFGIVNTVFLLTLIHLFKMLFHIFRSRRLFLKVIHLMHR